MFVSLPRLRSLSTTKRRKLIHKLQTYKALVKIMLKVQVESERQCLPDNAAFLIIQSMWHSKQSKRSDRVSSELISVVVVILHFLK